MFLASIPGKGFTGFLMEIIGRRWTITYCLAGSLPGLLMMAAAHAAGHYATVVFVAGALITGFTVLSTFYRGADVSLRAIPDGAARTRAIFWRVVRPSSSPACVVPFMLEPYTGSAMIFFGTLAVVASIGAFVPVLFGRETVGQLETVTEAVPELA